MKKNHILRLEGVCTEIQDYFFFSHYDGKIPPFLPKFSGNFSKIKPNIRQ